MRARLLLAVIFALLTALPCSAQADVHVYLLKGGFGGVFSTGLDDLAKKLGRRGHRTTVGSYSSYDRFADQAIHLDRQGGGPIVIVGHSWGADDAFAMAKRMADAGAPVALIAAFGPTQILTAPANVAYVINFYQGDTQVRAGRGFRGTIANVNLDRARGIDHFNIEDSNNLHARVIARIRSLTARSYVGRNIRQRRNDRDQPLAD